MVLNAAVQKIPRFFNFFITGTLYVCTSVHRIRSTFTMHLNTTYVTYIVLGKKRPKTKYLVGF
jgi:hypothetical protein